MKRLAGIALLGALAMQVGAANITWDTPVAIANTNDVIHDGGRFAAELSFSGLTTVDGTTFRQRGGFEGKINYSSQRIFPGDGSVCPDPSNPDVASEYRAMLQGLSWDQDHGGTYTITISNLTVGTQYKVQLWASNAKSDAADQLVTFSDGSNASSALDVGDGTTGLGMYVIGSFTATETVQQIFETTIGGNPFFNAIQVRDLSQPDGTDEWDYIPPPKVPGPAAIVWENAYDITDNTDVATTGTLFAAESLAGGSPTTVNGVTFSAQGASGLFEYSGGANKYSGVCASGKVSPEYTTLLTSVSWDPPPASYYMVTITNLTIGSKYKVQIWYQDANNGSSNAEIFSTDRTTGVTNSVILNCDVGGGLGQYVIGEFEAKDYVQMIAINKQGVAGAAGNPALNAIQVRELGWVAADPFQGWMASYGITNSSANDDDDSDGADNLCEYALNGDPTNAANAGTAPELQSDGTNVNYVYIKRDDTNLIYTLKIRSDLIYGNWTNGGYTATEGTIDATWTAVTNSLPLSGNDKTFYKLEIEKQ